LLLSSSLILTRTISVPEVLWTVVSLFAAIYVARLVWRAYGNLRYLRQMGWNSTREYSAKTAFIIFLALGIVPVLNTLAGLLAMAIPSASMTSVHPFTFVVTGIFILKSVLIAGFAFWIERRQVSLIRRIQDKGLHIEPGGEETTQEDRRK
jgi:hypothetical protein